MSPRLLALLDRVKAWPAERQAEAEILLEAIEAQNESASGLSDAQAAEVARRLQADEGGLISLDEARARLASRRA